MGLTKKLFCCYACQLFEFKSTSSDVILKSLLLAKRVKSSICRWVLCQFVVGVLSTDRTSRQHLPT